MHTLKLDTLVDSLWKSYNAAEDVDYIFQSILEILVTQSDSLFGLIYLEDESVLVDLEDGINSVDDKKNNSLLNVSQSDDIDVKPVYISEFIIAYQHFVKERQFPKTRIPKPLLKLKREVRLSNSIFYQRVPLFDLGLKTEIGQPKMVHVYDSHKTMLGRAVFILAPKSETTLGPINKKIISRFLDITVSITEAVCRRQIDRLSRKIISSSEGLNTLNPGDYFQRCFKEVCEQLKVDGASLIVRGLPSSETPLQLISAYPKKLPDDRNIYNNEYYSPTQWIFDHGQSCLIPSIFTLRKKMLDGKIKKNLAKEPIWCDSDNLSEDRAILYSFSKREDGIQYLLRCTNSRKNPEKLFNIFDRRIGQELVISFGLVHKAIENEQRSMKIFLDVKHELGQKLVGINSAANFVRNDIKAKKIYPPEKEDERLLKLSHIKNTINEIVKMLARFAFPLPTISVENDANNTPIKPYADLIKPICETFVNIASKEGKYFGYYKTDQLGMIYSDLSMWRHVVENLVNNMVKYTLKNEEMGIVFERSTAPEGGGFIHFASKSIPIRPDERRLLFEPRYRSNAAKKHSSDGQGLGLSLAKYIVAKYGGQILVRTNKNINIFSLKLPKHLFIPRKDI